MAAVLNFESWWKTVYFKKQMAGITRLRCIETRRATARYSNGGMTEFIDCHGNILVRAKESQGSLTANLPLNKEMTFFSKYPRNFMIICMAAIAAGCEISIIRCGRKMTGK